MTKGQHNYTNPFRKDGPFVRCAMCGKPATHAIVVRNGLDTVRLCDDHKSKRQEGSDVREVRESD